MIGDWGKCTFFSPVICFFSEEEGIFVVLKGRKMFEFDQYLGFLAFLTILTIGFWLMIFLLTFVVPYWLIGNLREMYKERKEAKRAQSNK
ncbi:hypothetical protein D2V93_09510 [Flagellimonas taeanensis]|jgi:uncharacterized membrane protein|nr:hypothetical protein D2V93_09510 [Allomuricauda taeanensis]